MADELRKKFKHWLFRIEFVNLVDDSTQKKQL